MKNLVNYVQNVNFHESLWNEGDTFIVAVSGGSDSMCLLDILVKIARKEDLNLIVAHVNYGLRGTDSDADEEVVRVQCAEYEIPFNVKMVKETGHKGSEAEWRKQRYTYFENLRNEHNAAHIVVGHNANDQAETLLLHLLRGSGLNGLCGMRYHRDSIIRPLLKVQKSQIIAYCKMHSITYREDQTNSDDVYKRNLIRNDLLPSLEKKYNKEIVKSLATAAGHIANDYDFISKESCEILPVEMNEKTASFSAHTYQLCHKAVQNMRLYQIISSLQGDEINITSRNIAEFHKAIISTKNKHQIVKMKGLKMQRKGDTVKFTVT